MSFSSRLRQAREQAGFTQQDLAEKLGITKSAVGNYENGVSSPKWDVLLRIFDVLQVEPNFLYQVLPKRCRSISASAAASAPTVRMPSRSSCRTELRPAKSKLPTGSGQTMSAKRRSTE